jgi:hypothetical protein
MPRKPVPVDVRTSVERFISHMQETRNKLAEFERKRDELGQEKLKYQETILPLMVQERDAWAELLKADAVTFPSKLVAHRVAQRDWRIVKSKLSQIESDIALNAASIETMYRQLKDTPWPEAEIALPAPREEMKGAHGD